MKIKLNAPFHTSIALVFLLSGNFVFAQYIEFAKPERFGFSSERLARIEPAMQAYVDDKKLPGTLTLVARKGKLVHLGVQGYQDVENNIPLQRDSIFRIYSMTKPVTVVAALKLWEEGRFHMSDTLDRHFPELANLKVYAGGSGEAITLEGQKTPIRIIDLFLHTAGFSYGFGDSEVDKLYQQSSIFAEGADRDSVLKALAGLPLHHQPGSKWHYSVSIDLLGFLVEKLSGKSLSDYMSQHIFQPLRMRDTGFYVPESKRHRLVAIYEVDQDGKLVPMSNPPLGDYRRLPKVQNGGGGLVSTADDYLVFAQMLLNGGEYRGARILGRKTVEYMRTNRLPQELLPFDAESPGEGFALGMSVTLDPGRSMYLSSGGSYGWGGMASTYFRIDPQEQIVMLALTQFVPFGYHAYHDEFRNLVYQALID